jgi:hypothetical protein
MHQAAGKRPWSVCKREPEGRVQRLGHVPPPRSRSQGRADFTRPRRPGGGSRQLHSSRDASRLEPERPPGGPAHADATGACTRIGPGIEGTRCRRVAVPVAPALPNVARLGAEPCPRPPLVDPVVTVFTTSELEKAVTGVLPG